MYPGAKPPEIVLDFIDDLLASHEGTFDPPSPEVVLEKIRDSVLQFFIHLIQDKIQRPGCMIHPIISKLDIISLDLIFNLLADRRILLQRATTVFQLSHYYGNLLFFDAVIALAKRILLLSGINLYNTNIRLKMTYVNSLKSKMVNKFKNRFPNTILEEGNPPICGRLANLSSTEQVLREAPDKSCAICLKEDIIETNFSFLDNCRHIFCTHCISTWIKTRYVFVSLFFIY